MFRASLLLALCCLTARAAAEPAAVDYSRDIQPLLARKCAACHGALRQESDLRLDAAVLIRQGGASGPAIIPGQSGESLLLLAVTGQGGLTRMPPEGQGAPLEEAQIALLRTWIDAGAPAPADEAIPESPLEHWSFQPAVRPEVPAVEAGADVRNPIDAFVVARLQDAGIQPVAEAQPGLLLRRLYLDLIGLPPTAEQLAAFTADPSPERYTQEVEQLLASPLYGERWGRHWMDVWRYSDWYGSRGIDEIRYSQRHIWRWRDWIVESLNADKGYDRMLTEMLAGDEVAPGDPDVLRATGFLGRNWYKFNRNVWLQETVEQTSVAFLGLTMKCARCHDHKFDPVTQREYYELRAFFEPHDFRTDGLAGEEVGVSRVFDANLTAPTYLFVRGDDRYPDETQPLTPRTPAALGPSAPASAPVELPVEAYYPTLAPRAIAAQRSLLQAAVADAQAALDRANGEQAAQTAALAAWDASGQQPQSAADAAATLFHDDFAQQRDDQWRVLSGEWVWQEGKLKQPAPGYFLTLVAQPTLPTDFIARVRYRTLPGGAIHSVGFSFDVEEQLRWQAVYTAVSGQTVQAFHRANGVEEYPAAGIVPLPSALDQELTVDVAARGQLLNVWVDGKLRLAYTMPLARAAGQFALWTHSAAAEFLEVTVKALPENFALADNVAVDSPSPFSAPSREALAVAVVAAENAAQLAAQQVVVAQAALDSYEARAAVEQVKWGLAAGDYASLAAAAALAEKQHLAAQASATVLQAEQKLALAQTFVGDATARATAVQTAEQELAAAQTALATAQAAVAMPGTEYTALGSSYPVESSGRRLALAQWLTDPRNPRTARVAVNHVWLRHFGQALVPSMTNFGLAGKKPSHPELLDWLAVELIENRWSLKHLHRLIVSSAAYRRTSAAPLEHPGRRLDPENRLLWRMNSRRMEAEIVRDSVLYLPGELDLTQGGPELDETLGLSVKRRSLYFRTTPDNKMVMLDLFDLANPNECYERRASVVPQQALALSNSTLALASARRLAGQYLTQIGPAAGDDAFVRLAFERLLCRPASAAEVARSLEFLAQQQALLAEPAALTAFPAAETAEVPPSADPAQRARENLILALYNHNDFVTIR